MSTLRDETMVGGAELQKLLETLPANVEKNVMRAALRAGAAVFLSGVQQRIPVKSGQLRASARITTRYKKGQVTASVKVGNFVAWYAHLVEYGTRPHYISVEDAEKGRGRKAGTFASMSTVNRRVLQIGGNFVGPTVHHPGTSARPFMRPAADAGFAPAVQAVAAKIRQRLTKQGLNVPPVLPQDPTT